VCKTLVGSCFAVLPPTEYFKGGTMNPKPTQSFKDLIMWQKAHKFVLGIYELAKDFPKSELYGLNSQLTRAAVSVPANIAEGYRKRSSRDKHRYMEIAHSSLEECRYYLILVADLGYGKVDELEKLLSEISRMLYGYKATLKVN
jgi:four helix bundle protein